MADTGCDQIHIRDLRARCIVGINPEERTKKQDVTIQITLWADLRAACQSDDLADTVDYHTLKLAVMEMVEGSSYLLIERLAERVAEIALSFEPVRQVRVLLEKPGALRFARTVGVEIVRRKQE
jgi:dihydroneopterin aldolase/D-erythro-7,8-dihydroneopterin triphosphate epimerase